MKMLTQYMVKVKGTNSVLKTIREIMLKIRSVLIVFSIKKYCRLGKETKKNYHIVGVSSTQGKVKELQFFQFK